MTPQTTTSSLRVMVVDDEPLARDELRFLLGEVGGVDVVAEAASSKDALAQFDTAQPDAVFVDLRMPGPDGLALSEALIARAPKLAIVVVSAHDEGAMRGYDVGVVDYVLKPARLPRLRTAVDRIRARLEGTEHEPAMAEGEAKLERLAVRRRGQFVVLDVKDVVYFEMKDELVWAVTETDRFALDLTLGAVEARLPEGFFRSHRGFVVRLDRIAAMEPSGAGTYELILNHPERPRVPLARERARALREIIPIAG
jgi:DNA-binding LytR/AlgR family response regulator